ncbi:hypothetical protein VTJ83DRAFT_4886 [Remersonia thermophila]|uniref:RING-type domain-containing protein n=1 Tax=Remersonia thermophila TaxID=72144 RepID=A0ABR4DB75_9PEZI
MLKTIALSRSASGSIPLFSRHRRCAVNFFHVLRTIALGPAECCFVPESISRDLSSYGRPSSVLQCPISQQHRSQLSTLSSDIGADMSGNNNLTSSNSSRPDGSAANADQQQTSNAQSNYCPRPHEVFFDPDYPEKKLTCAICFETELVLMEDSMEPFADSNPTLLPCGHVFGYTCLRSWIKTDPPTYRCPTCRYQFVHLPCGHYVLPRRLSRQRLLAGKIPATLPEGGHVARQCYICHILELHELVRNTSGLQGVMDDLNQTSNPGPNMDREW